MFQIMITKVPHGEAPENVRQKWLHLVLPCTCEDACFAAEGVLTGNIVDYEYDAYYVPQQESLAILAQKHPEAAAWWKANGFPKKGHIFVFSKDEAVILKSREEDDNPNFWG